MALDHPDAVERAAVLDIVPTRTLFAGTDQAFATAYYHWFFLIQPDGLPETMIGRDPEWFLRETLRRWSGAGRAGGRGGDPRVRALLPRPGRDPRLVRGLPRRGRPSTWTTTPPTPDARIACPLLVLWGEHGAMHRLYDVLDTWRPMGADVRGHPLPCGHFLPEEAPAETLAALLEFFSG